MIPIPQPYPHYKPSHVEWLGDIPAHWEVVPNRALMNLKKDVVGERADEFTLLSLTRKGVIPRDIENAFGKFPSSFDTYQVIEPGDLVFCLFDIDETPRTVGRSRLKGMVTGAYARFVCHDVDTREFLYLLYLSIDDSKRLRPLYSGLRKVIPTSTFLRAKVALPLKLEQRAIVRYLDHVDDRIRRYVSAKEKLIALLEEERQAVIHRAVTRGLDPNVPLKPSGVEWLGDVPAHWEVRRLKDCVSVSGGLTPSMDESSFWGGDISWVTPKDMKGTAVNQSSLRITREALKRTTLKLTDTPVVLIVVRGMILARKVPVAYATEPVTINQDMKALSPLPGIMARFLVNLLGSAQPILMAMTDEAGHGTRRLPTERWSNLQILLPPLPEQTAIVEHLDKTTAAIDAAITRARRQTELLREYRTRLIADVVTGKLDVRDAAANLPERAGE